MADSSGNDQELLRQIAKGSEQAFSAVYDRYQGPIYRFVLHMSGNSATAEEVTQEVFMKLITNPKSYDSSKGSLAAYMFGIARNLTRRCMADSRLDLPLDDHLFEADDNEPASSLDILAELSNADLLESLRNAILALPESYREVVVLCDLQELNYDSAAELLGCPAGTVASRLHRARTMLRTKLKCLQCVK
jgi:RNA polymerase sigma-70 factor, ECF subfamily